MRCKACGRIIDDSSRFCTFCDHDNYPEMNKVKTKGAKPDALKDQPSTHYTSTPSKTTGNKQKTADSKSAGCGFAIVIIAVILIILIRILSNA